jgi:putative ABC transport system ATP-binding protein
VPAIQLRNVTVSAMRDPNLVVVEDVNWTVSAGDYWVIAGLQGSGKSDFLLMAAGLMPPAKGSYLLFGEPMPIFEDARLQERLRLGLVFESGQLFNHLTVWENIALPLRYHRDLSKVEAANEAEAFVSALGLETWVDSTPGALARSWQKRVGLARALILRPELLLVDNPLGGLDLRHINWWMGFLDELNRGHSLLNGRPLTLVVTTADLRPWRSQKRCFSTIRDKRLCVLGDWAQLETEAGELVRELLMAETPKT